MANNINTNLAQRLFAYIQHADDLYTNSNILQVYKNAMIFIGDEKQIYVPAFNTYVGIGMTSYNNTVSRIAQAESEIAKLNQTLQSESVKGIYVQWNGTYYKPLNQTIATNNKLSGDVTISGIDNYNVATGFAYHNAYAYDSSTGQWVTIGENDETTNLANATSGITLTYQYDTKTEEIDGKVMTVPKGHRIVIDDSKTWAYMTRAYDYSLTFSREYTNSRIETLYHDILGIGESVLVPITYNDMFSDNPAGGKDFVPGEYYYWTGSGDPVMGPITTTEGTDPETGDPVTNYNLPTGWTQASGAPAAGSSNTYYVLSTTYNNTYNENISDGIQTLKEVAHILDQISDGAIGTTTYLTKTEWNTYGGSNNVHWSYTGNSYTNDNGHAGTYYRVYVNGKPTTSESKYAYYVVTTGENLGIQIAYSIAGNTADIQDLHEHVELAENGETTLRSISSYNIPSNLLTFTQWSNNRFTSTDTEQSLDDLTGMPSYLVGDARLMARLDLASTYVTYNDVYSTSDNTLINTTNNEVINDVTRYGVFEKVDMLTLPEWTTNTYYKESGGTMTLMDTDGGNWPTTVTDVVKYADKDNIYWIPSTNISQKFYNDKFEQVTAAYMADNIANVEGFYTLSNDQYTYWDQTTHQDTDYYRRTEVGKDYVQHAITDTANHIATTAWVTALYNDKQTKIESDLANILAKANKYTDDSIDALDNNLSYSYTEYNTWLTSSDRDIKFVESPGTTAYTAEQNTYWNQFVAEVGANEYAAYLSNKLKSHYISGLAEENGIVEITETTELPTDQLEITYNIWSAGKLNDANFEELNLSALSIDTNTADTNAEADLQKLFTYIYNGGSGKNHQIYYKDDANDATEVYVKAETTDVNKSNSSNGYAASDQVPVYILNNEGEYVAIPNLETANAFATGNTNSAYYQQVYKKEAGYFEVLTDSIEVEDNETSADYGKLKSFDIVIPGGTKTITRSGNFPTFYYKVYDTAEIKYLTGKVNHYDYSKEGGVGQNEIDLQVHITRIEDATATNSGLVDAFDVQNYIESMFTWVNISASVTETQLSTYADFYTEYSTIAKTQNECNALVTAVTATGTLYRYDNAQAKYIAIDNTYTATHLMKDATGNVISYATTGGAENSEFWAVAYDSTKVAKLYVTEQTVFTNPYNMTLTKAGQV